MKKEEKTWYCQAAFALVIIGAINWGLVAAWRFDIVQAIFGSMPKLAQAVYLLIGISGLWIGYCKYFKK